MDSTLARRDFIVAATIVGAFGGLPVQVAEQKANAVTLGRPVPYGLVLGRAEGCRSAYAHVKPIRTSSKN
jgi:hypothetical protein